MKVSAHWETEILLRLRPSQSHFRFSPMYEKQHYIMFLIFFSRYPTGFLIKIERFSIGRKIMPTRGKFWNEKNASCKIFHENILATSKHFIIVNFSGTKFGVFFKALFWFNNYFNFIALRARNIRNFTWITEISMHQILDVASIGLIFFNEIVG